MSKVCREFMQLIAKQTKTQSNLIKTGHENKIIFQWRYMTGQWKHENVFNIVNHQRNANQNYNKIPQHI